MLLALLLLLMERRDLAEDFDLKILDDRVRQHLCSNYLQLQCQSFFRNRGVEFDVKIFALADIKNFVMTQRMQGLGDGLALGVQN